MTKYYAIDPLSPGVLGEGTEGEIIDGEIVFSKIHIVFDYFPECFINISNCYFVNEELKSKLDAIDITGIEYGDVKYTVEEGDFDRNTSGKTIDNVPKYYHLIIVGNSGQDDFGFKRDEPRDSSLVVSQRVLDIINEFEMFDLIVKEWKVKAD